MSNQSRQKNVLASDTCETETEPEIPMTPEQFNESRSWKIGTVKQAPKTKGISRSPGENTKRLVVGFMILAWYTVPIFIHPLAQPFFLIPMIYMCHSEAHYIKMKSFEEQPSYEGFRWVLFFGLFYMGLPRYGVLERDILEKSGITEDKYPTLFVFLYER